MTDHQITDFDVHLVEIPCHAVHSHGCGNAGFIKSVLLELQTDSGFCGWGEGAPWPVFSGMVEATTAALDRYFRALTIGADPLQTTKIMENAV